MKIVGFQSGHDVSYCILEDGIPVLHEELERFTREKQPRGCGLKFFFERNPEMKDIDAFACGNPHPDHDNWFDAESCAKALEIVSQEKMYLFSHHDAHAANAFFTSEFKKSLVVTVDGGGNRFMKTITPENTEKTIKIPETLSVFYGDDNTLSNINLEKEIYFNGPVLLKPGKSLNIGRTWVNVTRDIFGLSVQHPKGNQAGTVMAMATMGDPKYVDLFDDNMQDPTHPSYAMLKEYASISEQEQFNVAASLQRYTENVFFEILSSYIETTSCESICFSGGVSLNCVMIGKIKSRFPQIKNVFCDPVPYDGGLSIGAARLVWHTILGRPRIYGVAANRSPYLGRSYSKEEVLQACKDETNIKFNKVDDTRAIKLLSEQKIIAVFGGGAESGRRALGNRSILADPRSSEMKGIINEKVKHRQWYRPFAPSILLEHTGEWFEDEYKSPYMSVAPKFKEEKRDVVPAVVHTDGTGRLQSVDKELNPWYHKFITAWYDLTGVPLVLNTSFNDREPIVETPEHAINCFMRTNIDYLYFYDYGLLIEKTT